MEQNEVRIQVFGGEMVVMNWGLVGELGELEIMGWEET